MFLTAQDLRVGNYINYENTTHIVTELHQEKIIHNWINSLSDGYVTRYNQILSIPITIKELDSLGFIEDFEIIENVKGYWNDTKYFVELIGDDYWFSELKKNGEIIQHLPVDFVHELQNVYFFFTKKELKIN